MRRAILPPDTFVSWAKSHGVQLNGVTIEKHPNGYGCGIIATEFCSKEKHPFITVPPKLVINTKQIWKCAGTDQDLCRLLEANGAFAKVINILSLFDVSS
jgi:hypothetical protein